ncbi:hypothetical protein I5H56_gp099 [Mycobacterium phage KristaRAM]|uniref:Uncharacterized protein n=1 Tax=Mycobacterium phage KristaRAM TaxID=2301700 RepID=A0A385DXH8_9CAUD|nr:hypothetical protein I5H56_gp099 [Mycobacterium phage KristaRAM]AXQ64156.1 hypothetical protein SEA_KRISTARAM_99 [Mycobacterium phage KristaRAM]
MSASPLLIAHLFIKGRVKFGVLRNNGRQEAASHPSVLFGWNVHLDIPKIGHTVRLRTDTAVAG